MALRSKVHKDFSSVSQELLNLDQTKEARVTRASRPPADNEVSEANIWFEETSTQLKVYFRHSRLGWALGLTLTP